MFNVKSLKKHSFSLGLVPPFLDPLSRKIAEGGPFDPHWPISRINPDGRF